MNSEPVLEIARRIDLRADGGYAWLAVIPSSEAGENSLVDIRDELEVSTGVSIRSIATGTAPIHELIAVIMSKPRN